MSTSLTRRSALLAGGAAPLAVGLGAGQTLADAPMQGATLPTHNRFALGGFEVTTLLVGSRTVEDPQSIFGMNVSAEEFSAVSAANFLPDDKVQFFFTPTV
ncbi:MAG: MBL fold metallo-hydrolase, partial [Pseudomonadota bacterium]